MQPTQHKYVNELEKAVKMDLGSILTRLPIVFTTRLDEMAILREDLSEVKPRDIIESIISESKPRYMTNDPSNNAKIYNTKHKYDNYAKNNADSSKQHYLRCKPNIRLNFKQLKLKIEEIKSKTNSSDKGSEVIKTIIKTNINAHTTNKLKNLLSMCKPLKIVLEDINKIVPKASDDIKMEVLSVSSDSDDDVIAIEKDKIIDKDNTISAIAINKNKGPAVNHTIRNINDLKYILIKEDLRDSVIVIYNLYLKKLDAYQIGEEYNVIEFKTRNYTEVYKFAMKKCKLIVNILACCWRNRNSYVLLLLTFKKYNDIAKFIDTTHPCATCCTCCCHFTEQPSNTQEGEIKSSQENAEDSLSNNRSTAPECNSKLIAMALKFKKNTKWKGYPQKIRDPYYKNKRMYKSCQKMLQLNNTNGELELYELGKDNLIYSKIVKNIIDESRWLLKTMSECRDYIHFTFTDPAEREKKIIVYRQMMNVFTFNTECFLRIPMTIDVEDIKKSNNVSDRDQNKSYKIKHLRSFMGTINKKSKVVSIISEIRKDPTPVNPGSVSRPPELPPKPSQVPRKPRQSLIMDKEVAQTINCLIKDILHRFRNVLLTINSDGKVAAALNAPLGSLSYPELNILSQILTHAQSQVDKLGLKPGTCLNPDAPMTINAVANKTSTTTDDASISTNSEKHNQLFKRQKKNFETNDTILNNFSTIISDKKQMYEKSFRSFLGETVVGTPKITNVYSLNNVNCTTLDILDRSFQESNVIEIDNDANINANLENSAKILNTQCVNEVMDDTPILNNEDKSIKPKKRKRKYPLKCKTASPKIRVTNTAVIQETHDEGPASLSLPSKPIEVAPLAQMAKSDSNYATNYSRLRSLLLGESKKKYLPVPQQEPPDPFIQLAPIFEVYADGTIIENTVGL